MGTESGERDIFERLRNLILAALLAFALTFGLAWLRSSFTYYIIIQIVFYVAGIIVLIETFRRDRYLSLGFLAGLVAGTLLNGITFNLFEPLIYSFALLFELYRIRTSPRS